MQIWGFKEEEPQKIIASLKPTVDTEGNLPASVIGLAGMQKLGISIIPGKIAKEPHPDDKKD